MIWVTTYRVKPFITKAETKEMMAVFAEAGPGPGTTAHYVAADGSHGIVISESDDVGGAYANQLKYREWIDFESSAMLSIDDAVPYILENLG